MERRDFIKLCAAAAAPQVVRPSANLPVHHYARAILTDEHGQPLHRNALVPKRNYIFHYPYAGTPCFLIDLGKPTVEDVPLKTATGERYHWTGGIGPDRSIVAYSAICSHRMAYPTPQISFISYREQSTAPDVSRPEMIHCCSEHSEYDPASGARVTSGPAPQPLAAVLLEYDPAQDTLFAVGMTGGELFDAFFRKYEMKLSLDYGANRAAQRVTDRTVVTELEHFCRQQVRC
ncbi:MAG TPA: (2Fe-2S)-binding protein [Burkholderiales bacterium]|nr:(2Fe-2S)-binding protein [Burkholderiales bacterium]